MPLPQDGNQHDGGEHREFDAAGEDLHCSQSKRAVLVKYSNRKKDVTLTVSFGNFDLVGMAGE
ncbi:MAG: hypothetical protein K6G66_10530 [Oscillospiraceae bacterium]|nr:hypothetical protein [Oscillospiraceae bacterium]